MAIKLIGSYSKRLGLPAYSSHQYSVTIETEVSSLNDIAGESARLYQMLQQSVDEQIQHAGFLPGRQDENHWRCSQKQQQLVYALVEEHNLTWNEVEELSGERFPGKSLPQLSKGETAALIDLLLEKVNGDHRLAA